MTQTIETDSDLEARVQILGARLLRGAQGKSRQRSLPEQWIETLLHRLNQEPELRVQALRFIDVLPSLENDADLLQIFDEYFHQHSFPMPAFGDLALKAGSLFGGKARAVAIRKAAVLLSSRFLAGQQASEVFPLMDDLSRSGRLVTLDRVGELTLSEAEAERYLQSYLDLIHAGARRSRQPLHLSLKLSSLYSRIAPHNLERGSEVVLQRLLRLSEVARAAGACITIDMEDFDTRPLILAVFEQWVMHPEYRDWVDVGIAQQAYLRDGLDRLDDLIRLAKKRETPFHIRWVRGAYWDQECIRAMQNGWSVPVWQRQQDTDRYYEFGVEKLMAAYPFVCAHIASHNPRSLAWAMAQAEERRLPDGAFEFQMLFGMSEPIQKTLVEMGYDMRVYLPFGEAIPGMAYLVRRLLENSSSQSLARLAEDTLSPRVQSLLAPPATDPEDVPEFRREFGNEPLHRFVEANERGYYANAIERVRTQLGQHWPLLINGQWQIMKDSIQSYSPADSSLLVGSVSQADIVLVEQAVTTAGKVWPSWDKRLPIERAALLRRAATLLADARDEFAAWEVFEAGKNWQEADADVCEAIDFLCYYANEAERLAVEQGVSLPGESNRYVYKSRGVVVIISPWNFPLAILVGMLSAALVSGNCVILKPSSDTPVVAARFVQLLVEAGLPAGVLAFLPGSGAEVGDALVEHPQVQMIAFTGSRKVGCRIIERAAVVREGQTHVKKVVAEMGGKNAIVVDASADLDEAVSGILYSAFGFQGQKCSACSLVIAVRSLYDTLLTRLVEAVEDLVLAFPWEPHCDLGPVINPNAQRRIEGIIEEGKQWGRLVYQGQMRPDILGCYVAPVIFADVDPTSPLAQEEIFGPVLAVIKASDFDEALTIANATDYALTGGVYSRSPVNLKKAEETFCVGNLYLNRGITGALVARQPFGGFKMSGVGSKAGGPDYLLQFMGPRCVTENLVRRGVVPW